MNFDYGNNKAYWVKSNSTIEAIRNGERTATTRFIYQGNMDYWSKVKVGDVISIIENSKNLDIIKTAVEDARVPAWLELDKAAFSGKVLQNPTKDDLDFDLNESLIVEFYSR